MLWASPHFNNETKIMKEKSKIQQEQIGEYELWFIISALGIHLFKYTISKRLSLFWILTDSEILLTKKFLVKVKLFKKLQTRNKINNCRFGY